MEQGLLYLIFHVNLLQDILVFGKQITTYYNKYVFTIFPKVFFLFFYHIHLILLAQLRAYIARASQAEI